MPTLKSSTITTANLKGQKIALVNAVDRKALPTYYERTTGGANGMS